METRKCNHISCTNDFTPQRSDQRFCSDRCRAAARRLALKNGSPPAGMAGPQLTLNAAVSGNSMPSPKINPSAEIKTERKIDRTDLPEGLPPSAAWIVRQQERSIDNLENQLRALTSKYETAIGERDKARTDLAEFKTETKIRDIESAKPSGLSGLLPSGLEGLLSNPYVGPVIGALLTKAVGAVPSPGEAISGQPDALAVVTNWLSSQSEETQVAFAEVMSGIVNLEADKLPGALQQILNLLKFGSTIQNQKANVTANGTYGYN